ncbi:MAG: TIGR03067 domain-containing protein [Planctomycetaceae bacterium]
MRIRIAAGIVVIPLVGVAGLLMGAHKPESQDALQGTWKLSAGESDGKALREEQLKDGKLVIEDEHYTVMLPGVSAITGVQKLDPTKEPKTIDITDDSGANKGKTCLGIYELKGEEFHVAFASPGATRPAKFATTPNSGHWVHVWKRVKQ